MATTPATSVCPGCGVVLPAAPQAGQASATSPGPTHEYMTSSPECWSRFGVLLAAQYSDPARMQFHQLVVDAYAVQHPGSQGDHEGDEQPPDPRAVQSVAIHLMTLCLFLDHGFDPARGTTLHRAMVDRPSFHHLPAPASRGALTVTSVPTDPSADIATVRTATYDWASSAWNAWGEHHDVVHAWLVESGLLPPG